MTMQPASTLEQHPEYAATAVLDALRRTDYARARRNRTTCISTTPAPGCSPSRRSARTPTCSLRQVLGNPHSASLSSSATTDARRRRAPGGARLLQRRRRLHRDLHAERERRAQARRRELPVRTWRPAAADVRQPQLGERHPRVRAGQGRDGGLRAADGARPADRSRPPRRAARRAPIPGSANLFAYPAQSNFSGVKHPLELDRGRARARAGTCCSTPRRSCRPIGSTCGA